MEKKPCPYCGKKFKRVDVHLRFCKAKKKQEKTKKTVSESTKKDIDKAVEQLRSDQVEIKADQGSDKKQDRVVLEEFNAPLDTWEDELRNAFQRAEEELVIELEAPLSHVNQDVNGRRRYASDQFLCLIRNYSSEIEQKNKGDIECYVCQVKNDKKT